MSAGMFHEEQNPQFRKPCLRVTALAVSFLMASGGGNLYAAPQPAGHSELLLPPSLGSVEEFHQGTNGKMIIHIQDAHDSLEAQENISKIIHHLVENSGVQTVFEEGYEGNVPTDAFFDFIRDAEMKEKVSYFFLDKLRIGAAEYAHINRIKDFALVGVDNFELYRNNIEYYQKSSATRQETEEDLNELYHQISLLANRFFPRELKKWLRLKKRLTDGELPLFDYLRQLRSLSLPGISEETFAGEYPVIALLSALGRRKDSGSAGSLEPVDPKEILREVSRLEEDLSQSFLDTDRDRRIFAYYQDLTLLHKLNGIELIQSEFELVKGVLEKIDSQEMAEFIAALTRRPLALSKEWEKNIENSIRFYEAAGDRDNELHSYLDAFMKEADQQPAILVYGGFHTNAIRKILKDKGFSFYILTPRITSGSTIHQDYYKQLMSVGHHAFEAPLLATAARPESVFSMARAVGEPLVFRTIREAASIIEDSEAVPDTPTLHRKIEKQLAARAELRSGLQPETRPLINPKVTYQWGTGNFRDGADIRRRVYTTYYTLSEHAEQMKEVLGFVPEEHVLQMLNEIENPVFHIDSKNYEQIKAYLWKRAKEVFADKISAWEENKDRVFLRQSAELLNNVHQGAEDKPELLGTGLFWRRAILTNLSVQLFDILQAKSAADIAAEAAGMLDNEGSPQGINVPIDFSDLFFSEVVEKPGRIALLAGDINSAALDLRLYGADLIQRWLQILAAETGIDNREDLIQEAKSRGWAVTLVVNSRFAPRHNNRLVQRNLTERNVRDLLSEPAFLELQKLHGAGLFRVVSFESEFPGTVLTDLNAEASEAVLSSDKVIALGEQNNVTLDGLNIDSFRAAPIRDFAHIFYTGIKYDKDNYKYPRFSILYVPAGTLAAIDYFPDLDSRLTALQFYETYKRLPFETWLQVVETARETQDGSILEIAEQSDALTVEEKLEIIDIRGPGLTEKIQEASQALVRFGGTYSRIDIPADQYRRRVMNIIHFPQKNPDPLKAGLELAVQFSQGLQDYAGKPKTKITFTDLLKVQPSAIFAFDFLYFITRNLILYFNQSNPHFTLGEKFFGEGIDLLKANINGEDVLYPSLYNKAAVGKRKDGTYIFGRIATPEQGTVTVPVGDKVKAFGWTKVNPEKIEDGSEEIILFTPFNEAHQDLGAQAPHTFGETRSLFYLPENDRYNFVMLNDKLLGVVRGRTEIPPFGTVLSVPASALTAEERSVLDEEAGQRQSEKKHVDRFEKVKFRFDLGPKWQDAEWIMGGGLLMVDDGKVENLRYAPARSKDSAYHTEGWALESSQRTQETPVEAELREARSTLGLTEDGQLFISMIDGRANNRTGATHQETVDWLQEYFEARGTKVRYAMDLDSASSVALGLISGGKFQLLNQTARGSDSKLNDLRYYNHLAYLKPAGEDFQAETRSELRSEAEAFRVTGAAEEPDDAFRAIYEAASEISPGLDLKLLYDVYLSQKARFGKSFSKDSEWAAIRISRYYERLDEPKEDEAWRRRYPDGTHTIRDDKFLANIKKIFRLHDAYYMDTNAIADHDPTRHFVVGEHERKLYVPSGSGELVQLYVLAGHAVMMGALNREVNAFQELAREGIRTLGRYDSDSELGSKESGFLIFERLGLSFPSGVALSEQFVESFLGANDEGKEALLSFLLLELSRAGIDIAYEVIPSVSYADFYRNNTEISVRSNPKYSMPGLLTTEKTVVSRLRYAIERAALAWHTERAKQFRAREGIPDSYDLSLIIQKWVSGEKKNRSDAFFASGVFSTRHPDTAEDRLYGQYLENAAGDKLMTGGVRGEPIEKLAEIAPDIFQQILEAKAKLEAAAGPQEVEFVVEAGKLWFLQTRKLNFSPQGAIAYLKQEMSGGRLSQARALPQIEKLQRRVGSRTIYRVKEGAALKPLAAAAESTSGAFRGRLAWNKDQVDQFTSRGEPVIFVSNRVNQDAVLSVIFDYPKAGLVTGYGDGSSHEANLSRYAGIPSLINLEVKQWRLSGEDQGIVLLDGSVLKEGDRVIIDGSRKILAADEDVLEENGTMLDISYGIHIPSFKQGFQEPYLDTDGSVKPEFTLARLEALNQEAEEKRSRLKAGQDIKAAFISDLEKHFLHELLFQRQVEQQKYGRSELRLAPEQESPADLRAARMIRSVRNLSHPVTVFLNAGEFAYFSPEQKEEYLYAAVSRNSLSIVVYNERGETDDAELKALLKLNRVIRTERGLKEAFARFTKQNVVNVHLSSRMDPDPALVRDMAQKTFFFKQESARAGTLTMALNWTLLKEKNAELFGIRRDEQGFWIVAQEWLDSLHKSYQTNMAFAWAA